VPSPGRLELVAALRNDAELADLPILLSATCASSGERIDSLEVGVDDYLIKPFTQREFIAHVKGILALSELRRDVAERLRRSEARLKAAVDLVGVALYAWNPSTNALQWDDRLRAMWGLPAHALIDYDIWFNAIHRDDRAKVAAAVENCTDPEGDGVFHIEYRVIGITDRVERWISTYGQTRFHEGKAVGFAGAALDITERKRADVTLRASEERFRQFAEHSIDVLTILDIEAMRFDYLSPAFEKIWGEPTLAALTDIDHWSETIHPDDLPDILAALERVRQGENVIQEYRINRRDGTVRWVRHGFFPMRDETGCVWRAGGIAEDITHHKGDQIYVVESNENSRNQLSLQLQSARYEVKTFVSSQTFLEIAPVLISGCVILEIGAPTAEGLATLRELKARRIELPVIANGNSHGDIHLVVQAMKSGAVDWLENPYAESSLLAAVASALAGIREATEARGAAELARKHIADMSSREREVLVGLIGGATNKIIARWLGISPRTVELHRARVMERLGVRTLSAAVLLATSAGLTPLGIAAEPGDRRKRRPSAEKSRKPVTN
jgi:PAS domain S-box-containing protein